MTFKAIDPIERFWNKVKLPAHPHDCWMWQGNSSNTYGQHRVKDIIIGAHRFSYEHFVGTIPEGMHVCHSCDTPKCVNPQHLWVGTNLDNRHDMLNKGRMSAYKLDGSTRQKKSGLPPGIWRNRNKFVSYRNGKYLGTFKTVEEASAAYQAAP